MKLGTSLGSTGLSFAFLTLLYQVVQTVPAITGILVNVTFNTNTSTDPQALYGASIVTGAADSYMFAPNNPVMCFATLSGVSSGAPDQVKCFMYDSNMIASINPAIGNVYSLAVKETYKIYVAGAGSFLKEYTLANNSGTYTLTETYSMDLSSGTNMVSSAVKRSGTNYIYFGPTNRGGTPNQRENRWDVSANTFAQTASTVALVTGDTYIQQLFNNQWVFSAGVFAYLFSFDVTTLASVVSQSMAQKANCILLDNLNNGVLYYGELAGVAPFNILSYDISAGGVTSLQTATLTRTTTNIVNLGTFNYFVATKIASALFSFVNKQTMVEAYAPRGTLQHKIDCLVGVFLPTQDWVRFASISNVTTFQSFAVLFDTCVSAMRSTTTFICTQCPTGTYFNDTNAWNTCWDVSRFTVGTLTPSFDRTTFQATLLFNFAPVLANNNYNQSDIKISLYNGTVVTSGATDIPFTVVASSNPNQIIFNLTTPTPAPAPGDYSIVRVSSRSGIPMFFGNGVLYPNPTFDISSPAPANNTTQSNPTDNPNYPDSQTDVYATTGRVLSWIIKLINLSLKVLLMPLDLTLSAVIDRHTAWFSYLKTLDGPFISIPYSLIYHLSSLTFFGFWVPNPHPPWTDNNSCGGYKTGITQASCDLFTSYGQNVDILAFAAFWNVVIYLAYKIITAKASNPDSMLVRGLTFLNKYFGIGYLVLFAEGVSLDLLGLSIVNLSVKNDTNNGRKAGFSISLIIVLLYTWLYAQIGLHCWKLVKAQGVQETPFDGDKSIMSVFTIEYKPKLLHRYFYFMPVFTATKNLVIILLATYLMGSGMGQIAPIFVVELVNLVVLSVGRVKASPVFNAYEISFAAISTIYMLVKMATFGDDAGYRQNTLGPVLGADLMIMAYSSTIYVIFRLAHGAYNAVQALRHGMNPRVKPLESPDSLSSKPRGEGLLESEKILNKSEAVSDPNKISAIKAPNPVQQGDLTGKQATILNNSALKQEAANPANLEKSPTVGTSPVNTQIQRDRL